MQESLLDLNNEITEKRKLRTKYKIFTRKQKLYYENWRCMTNRSVTSAIGHSTHNLRVMQYKEQISKPSCIHKQKKNLIGNEIGPTSLYEETSNLFYK